MFESTYTELLQKNTSLQAQLTRVEKRCEQYAQAYEALQQQVKELLRNRFGKKSERYIDPENPQIPGVHRRGVVGVVRVHFRDHPTRELCVAFWQHRIVPDFGRGDVFLAQDRLELINYQFFENLPGRHFRVDFLFIFTSKIR